MALAKDEALGEVGHGIMKNGKEEREECSYAESWENAKYNSHITDLTGSNHVDGASKLEFK